ncbi:hypothetical protein BC833DRAFT_582508 [Globomyces pollinis-pini]|nr:hypothetical protein BC833DRAFT_582508 [Globomyces pollinis-pini]
MDESVKYFLNMTKTSARSTQTALSFVSIIYPIVLWLVLFASCKYIPTDIRPSIKVELLPYLESFLFRTLPGFLSLTVFSATIGHFIFPDVNYWKFGLIPGVLLVLGELVTVDPIPVLDALLFLPYGVLYYLSPVLFVIFCHLYRTTDLIRPYCHALGWMNVAGVVTQILIPCAAPWYNDKMGNEPANYSMPGDPAGLVNVDKLFGTEMYTTAFNSSPLVFGALPSLHSAMAVIFTFFCFKLSTRLGLGSLVYMCWMWMSTIYFRHHYMFDLYLGGVYALVAFKIFYVPSKSFDKSSILPVHNKDIKSIIL